jgi:hypothetical protein
MDTHYAIFNSFRSAREGDIMFVTDDNFDPERQKFFKWFAEGLARFDQGQADLDKLHQAFDLKLGNLDRCTQAVAKAGPTLRRAQEIAEQLQEAQIASWSWRRGLAKHQEATRGFLAEAEARRAPLLAFIHEPAPRPGTGNFYIAEKSGRVAARSPLDARSSSERRFADVGLTKLQTPQVSQADHNDLEFAALFAKRRHQGD